MASTQKLFCRLCLGCFLSRIVSDRKADTGPTLNPKVAMLAPMANKAVGGGSVQLVNQQKQQQQPAISAWGTKKNGEELMILMRMAGSGNAGLQQMAPNPGNPLMAQQQQPQMAMGNQIMQQQPQQQGFGMASGGVGKGDDWATATCVLSTNSTSWM